MIFFHVVFRTLSTDAGAGLIPYIWKSLAFSSTAPYDFAINTSEWKIFILGTNLKLPYMLSPSLA